jgi:hypothetical protein
MGIPPKNKGRNNSQLHKFFQRKKKFTLLNFFLKNRIALIPMIEKDTGKENCSLHHEYLKGK